MKTKLLAIIGYFFTTVFQLCSQGYIVPNGVNISGGYQINVLQNPTNGNYTGFALFYQGANTFQFVPFVDESVRVFFVGLNEPISLQPILAGDYTELAYPNTYFFSPGFPYYLGLYTSENFPVNGIYADPLFGWTELVNNGGVLELLDSALVYKAVGIYAGTQTIIPEPRTLSLAALSTLLLGFRRWRYSAR